MNSFEIFPYIGVGELKFGMRRAEAYQILGNPNSSKNSRFSKEVTEYWMDNGLQLVFSGMGAEHQLLEISLYSNVHDVILQGIPIYKAPSKATYLSLCKLDGNPREKVGVTILFKFGIAISGFLHVDTDAKSITVFQNGRWSADDQSLKAIPHEKLR